MFGHSHPARSAGSARLSRLDRADKSQDNNLAEGSKEGKDEKSKDKTKRDRGGESKDTRGPSHPGTETPGAVDKRGVTHCDLCQRSVGGGEAGKWQHERSPQHLATWIYNYHQQQKSWKDCLAKGKRWSQDIWAQKSNQPPEAKAKSKRAETPPPIRADTGKNKWNKKDNDDKDPDSGYGGKTVSERLVASAAVADNSERVEGLRGDFAHRAETEQSQGFKTPKLGGLVKVAGDRLRLSL